MLNKRGTSGCPYLVSYPRERVFHFINSKIVGVGFSYIPFILLKAFLFIPSIHRDLMTSGIGCLRIFNYCLSFPIRGGTR